MIFSPVLFAYNPKASDDAPQLLHVLLGGNMTGEAIRGIFQFFELAFAQGVKGEQVYLGAVL